ncbi:sigma 54-interacting transcriptional regulator [Hyalangium gracile]|uniref:sigma 54-interacting transcriptional regulator n=1 Tax=Hyalangium gracile TaxID=394092 RepID=UPI001CCDDF11|nr:sigma 54-interacting transcriptional regulator [Hyalangium gracile]
MPSAPPPSARATRPLAADPSPQEGERAYLLVLEGESSFRFPLPSSGMVLIGRDAEADLSLRDDSVSRRHARLVLKGGEVRITDLDSQNGTLVNGRRVEGAHPLVSGDVVKLGAVVAVLRAGTRPASTRRTLEPELLLERLRDEVERSLRYNRPLAVLALVLPESGAHREAVEKACATELGGAEAAGWMDDAHLLVVLPEVSGEPGEENLGEQVEALAMACPGARLGYAMCPTDGCDADTLVAAARAAADDATPGLLRAAADSASRLTLAERSILVADPAMVQIYALIRRLAASDLPVLIHGETGVGKENAAFAVHHWSRRSAGPFVTLNCAAIPEGLVESELFGHEKGSFTGAAAAKTGILESAHGGTVFLDEVGELPLPIQAKLLRVLETKRITRVGDVRERAIDIRIVAATHRDLEAESQAGRFRQDLYFRLGAATVVLPPLRERPREVSLLARAFLAQACQALGRRELVIAADTLRVLSRYRWPGNVRELRNLMEYAAAAVAGDVLEPHHLPPRVTGAPAPASAAEPEASRADASPNAPAAGGATTPARGSPRKPLSEEIRELERRRMEEALQEADGVQARAAALIGMPIRTFSFKMKQLGLSAKGARGNSGS